MKRLFIETNVFKKLIDEFEDENIERMVKDELLKDPQKGDLIKGTSGFRKINLIFDKNYKVNLNSKEKKRKS